MTTVAPPADPAARLVPAAELGLVALTLAAIFGFGRVYDDISFAPYLVTVAMFTHGLSAFARRRAWPVGAAAAVGLVGTVLLCAWLLLPGTTVAGLPSGATLDAVSAELTAAWEQFPTAVPPTDPLTGFVLVSCLAVFVAAFLADWAAFRLWSVFEALVPASTLFLFCTLLGASTGAVPAAVFVTAALVFVLLHRAARQEGAAGWVTAPASAPSRSSVGTAGLRAGVALALLAVTVGMLGGDRLPGAQEDALLDWRGNRSRGGQRTIVSPLVDIRDRLVQQTATVVMTVEAEAPAYWRLTGLDEFDGDVWQALNKFSDAEGRLDQDFPSAARTTPNRQTFNVAGLNAVWVPAAFRPTEVVSTANGALDWNAESATLIPDGDERETSDGLEYTVVSAVPEFVAADLERATNDRVPDAVMAKYTRLPEDFSDVVRRQAEQVTAPARTPYQKALRLQDFFRRFEYSTEFPGRHDEDAIVTFLRERRGFCEQFAGSFAAMARAIGLPARVAVGFTPGVQDPSTNRYVVRGQQAHAWPEVLLGDYGWVPFEPTPGRGIPNGTPWTNVQPQQDTDALTTPTTAVPGSTPTTAAPTPGSTTPNGTTAVDVTPGEAVPPPVEPLPPDVEGDTATSDGPAAAVSRFAGSLLGRALFIGLPIVALVGGYYLLVTSLKRSRRHGRRTGAADPSARTRVAWAECVEALTLVGLGRRSTETLEEYAVRVGATLGDAGPQLVALAGDAEFATYAPDLLDDDSARRADAAAAAVIAAARMRTKPLDDWLDRLDPRPLFGPRASRPTHRTVTT